MQKHTSKKIIIFLIALFVVMAAVCAICMMSLGRTYTYTFPIAESQISEDGLNIKFENEGIVAVKEINGREITFECVSKGETYVEITTKSDVAGNADEESVEIGSSIKLWVSPANILINRTDVDFNGYMVIVYAAFIYLAAALVCLIISTRKTFKENFYSYESILKVGVAIFIIMLLFTLIIQMTSFWNNSVHGLYGFIANIVNSGSNIIMLLIPILAIIFILISISNAVLLKREGKRITNILGVILGFVFIAASFAGLYIDQIYWNSEASSGTNLVGSFIKMFFCFLVLYFDCIFLSACICAGIASKRKPAYDKDFIIVLGCGIKKDGTLTPLLKGRTDCALNFAKKQFKKTGKECIIIPSGGQGSDEIIPEGEAMGRYLLEKGVPENDMIIENRSRNTRENLIFSKKLADKKKPASKLAFATTNYHLFRSGLLANEAGIKAEGIGSKTKWYFWPNAFLREFVGVMRSELKYHAAAAVIILVVTLVLLLGYNQLNVI